MSNIKQRTKGDLIIMSGTTCAGKGTIIKELLKRNENICLSISYTSRAKRGKEVDGEDYYFISREEFEKKIANGDFLEYAKVRYGEYFGTPRKEIEEMLETGKDVILEIDVQGAKQVKELLRLEYPLSACYNEWLKNDYSYMDMLQDTVDNFSKELVKENEQAKKKKRNQPER